MVGSLGQAEGFYSQACAVKSEHCRGDILGGEQIRNGQGMVGEQ